MRIAHIITGLGVGGAETALARLLEAPASREHDSHVFSLTTAGPLAHRIEATGTPVTPLHMRPGMPSPLAILRLRRLLRDWQPDVIQSWMYHADLIASFCAGRVPLVWGIRHSDLSPESHKRTTRLVAWLCARLSHRIPRAILCNSHTSARMHAAIGYDASKIQVIPNGFDTDVFVPSEEARRSVRRELGLPEDAKLVGYVARFHVLKDHLTFFRAAAALHREMPEVHFVLAGKDIDHNNPTIAGWLNELDSPGLRECIHLLGPREDIPRLTAAFDVATLTSTGESFPNVLGEAMSCGVPCVTTDVGDAREIVGETGHVADVGDFKNIASSLQQVSSLSLKDHQHNLAARERIINHYSIKHTVGNYYALYQHLAENAG